MLEQGLIQIYTSKDEDVNFAPLGLALRAVGHNLRVYMACFIQHEWMQGAMIASSLLKPNLVIEHAWDDPSSGDDTSDQQKIAQIRSLFSKARSKILSKEYDMVILNGITRPCNDGIISAQDMLKLIEERPQGVELVISGSMADDSLIERADLVTEMHISKSDITLSDDTTLGSTQVEVVTGSGKGKTTYCLGKSLLMSCTGIRSIVLQFIKSPRAYGEVLAIERIPFLDIKTMGEGFLFPYHGGMERKHKTAAKRAWEECIREVFSLKYGMIVLDEINIATYYGLIHGERVREMIFLKPERLHLILSGRGAHLEVMEGAHRVIEMREIKHPFRKGIKARKGIEY